MKPAGVYVDSSDQSPDCAPLAAILYDAGSCPGIEDLASAAGQGGGFAVTHRPPPEDGWAEVLRDGLTFDVRGLAGGPANLSCRVEHRLGLQSAELTGLSVLTVSPGPHLAGAEHLLPVIRVVSALLIALSRIGDARAICWNPTKCAVSPALFERAVTPWLEGGPFPALALTALVPLADGSLSSEGLKFLTGQEFTLTDGQGRGREHLSRVAVRLVDWLVAHGPVTGTQEAVLAGTGVVVVEAETGDRIVARCH